MVESHRQSRHAYNYGYDATLHVLEQSAPKLGVDQIDPLILHQALPSAFDRTWRPTLPCRPCSPRPRSPAIGFSNFMVEHLTTLLGRATVLPAVNQIECHPCFTPRQVQSFGAEHGILMQAWSPIGGITSYRDGSHGSLEDPVIANIANARRQTAAHVILR